MFGKRNSRFPAVPSTANWVRKPHLSDPMAITLKGRNCVDLLLARQMVAEHPPGWVIGA